MAKGSDRGAFLDCFSALEDPRQAWKVVYPLDEVLLLVLCAVLSGADDFVEIADWGRMRLGFLRRFRPFAAGVPSHDTLNDVCNALDGDQFQASFIAWVAGLAESEGEIIALDGKTSRRTGDRRRGRDPLHLVSAWASKQRLVLGQQAVAAGSNEIVAIPALLEKLAIQGALVTIDAIGCQRDIAEKITDAGGDYLLALKTNQPALHDDVRFFFDDDHERGQLACHQTVDGDHGRIETRRHWVASDVAWLQDAHGWPALAAVAMVEAEREIDGKTTTSRRYYIASAPLDAKHFAAAVRAHWTIENRLHWVMDVVFHDDLSRLRTGHAPQNMATVRHIALNLIKAANDKASIKVRRKKAAWSTEYLENIIRQAA
jgi:predicted transposase YbfD/YdcC|tara:strand:+ start:64 stop:1182 length:1119 start_codon:yes stop_codon:yes gene_type:complete